MLRIKNWSEWQSYRTDRGAPPWIKVHRNILTNRKWATLSDKEKGQLVSMWIVAADSNGELPDDPKVLKKICQLEENIDLQVFVNIGFLERDVTVASNRRQHDVPETETETERKEISKDISKRKISKPDDVSQNVWDDFLEHRKAKKAPVTETVIRMIRAEAEKVSWSIDQALTEMCARGWQGFKSEWVLNLKGKSNGTNQPTRQQRIDAALDRAWEKTGGGPDWKETPALGTDQAKLCSVQPVRQITGRS